MTDWFETLFGFRETSPEEVRENIELRDRKLYSKINSNSYGIGELTTPYLEELRSSVAKNSESLQGKIKVQNVIGDIRELHCDPANANALFQVASQFNLLEMVNPEVTPEHGVTRYAFDRTQGPACAIAAGAATVYRNYFAQVNGKIGQTSGNQIDCLSGVGKILGNTHDSLWSMSNGYALCSSEGLSKINDHLYSLDEIEKDQLRQSLRIGLHSEIEVTDKNAPKDQFISQAFCSALPVAYSNFQAFQWDSFANLILEGAYEATLCAAVINARRCESNQLFLTQLGGGAFGNESSWIYNAMTRAFSLYKDFDLDIKIVSYGSIDMELHKVVDEWNQNNSKN